MSRACLSGLVVSVFQLLSSAVGAAEFGPGEAAAGARAVDRHARKADFKVLVWYHQKDPLGTFKYEIYDLRREQEIAKIEAWINEMRTKYPAFIVLVHDVDLARQRGATESLKVGSVIQNELAIAAARAGIITGGGLDLGPGPNLGVRVIPRLELLPGSPAGNRATYMNSPSLSYPLPSVRRPP
jgi:hypothetical protein